VTFGLGQPPGVGLLHHPHFEPRLGTRRTATPGPSWPGFVSQAAGFCVSAIGRVSGACAPWRDASPSSAPASGRAATSSGGLGSDSETQEVGCGTFGRASETLGDRCETLGVSNETFRGASERFGVSCETRGRSSEAFVVVAQPSGSRSRTSGSRFPAQYFPPDGGTKSGDFRAFDPSSIRPPTGWPAGTPRRISACTLSSGRPPAPPKLNSKTRPAVQGSFDARRRLVYASGHRSRKEPGASRMAAEPACLPG
jgi:hypothetical protein